MTAADDFLLQGPSLLARLDQDLAAAATPREVAWTLCEFAGRELALDDCVVYLVETDGKLGQQAAWGPKQAAEHVLESRLRLARGQGVVGDCARQQQTQRIDDVRHDPRYVADDQPNLSELAAPIHADGVLYGVLDSEHPTAGFYAHAHVHAFEAIAARGAARLRRLRI